MSVCESPYILRQTDLCMERATEVSNFERLRLSDVESLLLRGPKRWQFDSLDHRYSAEIRGLAAIDDRLDDPGLCLLKIPSEPKLEPFR